MHAHHDVHRMTSYVLGSKQSFAAYGHPSHAGYTYIYIYIGHRYVVVVVAAAAAGAAGAVAVVVVVVVAGVVVVAVIVIIIIIYYYYNIYIYIYIYVHIPLNRIMTSTQYGYTIELLKMAHKIPNTQVRTRMNNEYINNCNISEYMHVEYACTNQPQCPLRVSLHFFPTSQEISRTLTPPQPQPLFATFFRTAIAMAHLDHS